MRLASFVLGLLVLVASSAHAAPIRKGTGASFSSPSSTSQRAAFNAQPTGAAQTFGAASSKPTITVPVAGSAWNNFMASARAMAEPAEIAKSFATGRGLMLPLAMAGTALGMLADTACLEVAGGTLTQGAQWNECKFRTDTTTQWAAANSGQGAPQTGWFSSKAQAAQGWVDWHNSVGGTCGDGNQPSRSVHSVEPLVMKQMWCGSSTQYDLYNGSYFSRSTNVEVRDGWQPTSPATAEQKLTEKIQQYCTQGMPDCPEALKSALDGGLEVEVGVPQVQGPDASPPVTETSTSERTNELGQTIRTVTNTTTNFNYTYNGDTVTRTQTSTTVTTTTNLTTGETTTTTETIGKPAPKTPEEQTEEQKEDYKFSDSELPPVPDLYEQKYPDGLAGVWNTRVAELKAGPIFAFINSLVPTIGSAAVCPQFPFPAGNVLGIQVGGDLSVPCSLWTFIRLVMLISATLLARRLIFGG